MKSFVDTNASSVIPPAFQNIRWGLFIVFGIMCLLAATQFWLTYPEVSCKINWQNNRVTDLSNRPAAKPSKRLRFCSAMMDLVHGGLRRATRVCSLRLLPLLPVKPKTKLGPALRRSSKRLEELILRRRKQLEEVANIYLHSHIE